MDDSCPASSPRHGNPIYPLTGSKRQDVDLGISVGGQALRLSYDSKGRVPEISGLSTMLARSPASFGPLWQTNLHRSLVLQSAGGPGSPFSTVAMQRGASMWATAGVAGFDSCTPGSGGGGGSGAPYVATVSPELQLSYVSNAGRLRDERCLTMEDYDADGRLSKMSLAQGGVLSFTYSDSSTPPGVAPAAGLLIGIEDQVGRTVGFTYELPADPRLAPRIRSVTDVAGQVTLADYDDAGNLQHLSWPDGHVRSFVYDAPGLPWALTGLLDENRARHATYGYDAAGRAISTELAGGVNRYAVSHASPPQWSVTEQLTGNLLCREHRWQAPVGTVLSTPSGGANTLGASSTQGMVGVSTQSQPGGSGCEASASAQVYDGKGNVSRYDDFNKIRSCFAYDTTRNLRTVTLQGLPSTQACPADLAGYVVPANKAQRKLSTKWHPLWRLETGRAEPLKLTTTVYNDQADPFKGNQPASCVEAGAPRLPDGSALAVVCSRHEQATADATGSQGFAAAGVGDVRTWRYTYNRHGQMLTETDPRDKLTLYEYWTDTSFPDGISGHTQGDLKKVTDAAGHTTLFNTYNKRGQVLSLVLPNGSRQEQAYHVRGWLRSVSLTPAGGGASLTTQYEHHNTGLLKRVTEPDGSWSDYTYDDAHRLTDVEDSAQNKVHYTLNDAGQRTGEAYSGQGAVLARTIKRSFDALGRMQSVQGLP